MNKTNTLVSCIIPTKNRSHFVTRAIQSVLRQTYNNIEIIVVDDSTNGETEKALAFLGGHIRYIKNEQSRGAPYSRNIGLDEARGDAVAFLDDDDIWLPEKTITQLKWLEKYPIVTCNYIAEIKGRRHFMKYPEVVFYEDLLAANALGSCSFVMIDRNVTKDCRFDEDLKSGQDWDFWLTVMKENSIEKAVNVGKYLVDYNIGDYSRISNTNEMPAAFLVLYDKRRSEYTPKSTRLLFLYNAFQARQSFMMWILREWMKAEIKGKGYFFLTKLVIKRFFRRMELF